MNCKTMVQLESEIDKALSQGKEIKVSIKYNDEVHSCTIISKKGRKSKEEETDEQ